MLSRTIKLAMLWGVTLIAVGAIAFVPPIAQPIDYHNFADTRTLFEVPNFWNVVSNVPFLLVGVLGLGTVLRRQYQGGLPSLHWIYAIFFIGIAAVCFGSGYYHWSPSNATLAWDRLPMAVAFMAMVAIILGEHINERVANWTLMPLIAIGVFSVVYWDYTESIGRGDLRLYGLVQFLSLAVILLTFCLFPSRLSGLGYLWAMFGGYVLAKVLEELDSQIYSVGHLMSGHALKHIAAAAGMYCFLLALQNRKVTND